MATNFSPCKGSYVLNQFPSNVMFGMNGFHVSASGAIQGHHGSLVCTTHSDKSNIVLCTTNYDLSIIIIYTIFLDLGIVHSSLCKSSLS